MVNVLWCVRYWNYICGTAFFLLWLRRLSLETTTGQSIWRHFFLDEFEHITFWCVSVFLFSHYLVYVLIPWSNMSVKILYHQDTYQNIASRVPQKLTINHLTQVQTMRNIIKWNGGFPTPTSTTPLLHPLSGCANSKLLNYVNERSKGLQLMGMSQQYMQPSQKNTQNIETCTFKGFPNIKWDSRI